MEKQSGNRRRLPGVGGLIAVFVAAATLAQAEDRKLDAAEITELLTGKTALGENRGRDTRQYFDASGVTDYVERGGEVDPGKWRVDDARGQYCSLWARGGWACYDVVTDGSLYYWIGEGYRSPFTMTDGRALAF